MTWTLDLLREAHELRAADFNNAEIADRLHIAEWRIQAILGDEHWEVVPIFFAEPDYVNNTFRTCNYA